MDELAARHSAVYARCAAALRAAGAPAYEYLLHLFGVVVRCTAIGVAAGSVPASSLSQGLALVSLSHVLRLAVPSEPVLTSDASLQLLCRLLG